MVGLSRNRVRLTGSLIVALVAYGLGLPSTATANHPPPQIQLVPEPPSGWLSDGEYAFTATIAASERLLEAGGYIEGAASVFPWHSCVHARTDCPLTLTKTFVLRPAELPDGERDLVIRGSDWSDPLSGSGTAKLLQQRWSERRFRLRIDHTAPAPPERLAVAGGSGWRSVNRFRIGWVNKKDPGTPVVGAEYRLCPAADDRWGCSSGQREGIDLSSIDDLSVPGTGVWRLQVALRDAMGHIDRNFAAITYLRLDLEPPRLNFLPRTGDDPARIEAQASDYESGIASVAIEARRPGETTWRPLSSSATSGRITAVLDDDKLPAGTYEIRARATDAVGNERALTLGESVELPIRIGSDLTVGKPTRSQRNRTSTLDQRPSVRYGARVRLVGRLTDAYGDGRPHVPVEVYERLAMPSVTWRRVSVLTTDRTGSFTYSAPKGAARTLRFHYAGTPTTRSATANVNLRVRAVSTLQPSRRKLTNGETMILRGRLLGGRVPPSGKLVTLQAWTTRGWVTFGNARARARDGKWRYRYTFRGTTYTARYRFRAVVPREESYPFARGASPVKTVLVRGST